MIAIIDYGVGNLFSLKSSFAMIGQDVCVTDDKRIIDDADRLILPGVGAFVNILIITLKCHFLSHHLMRD